MGLEESKENLDFASLQKSEHFYFENLIPGILLKRYKRFFADVLLENGEVVVAHCPNTGSMKSLLFTHQRAFLSANDDPKRKLKYTLEFIEPLEQLDLLQAQAHLRCPSDTLACVNTHRANKQVAYAIEHRYLLTEKQFDFIKAEVPYGSENSRIDFLLQNSKNQIYVEVKNATYKIGNSATFPDAITERGQKHLRELMGVVESNQEAICLFWVNRSDVNAFLLKQEIDLEYYQWALQALKRGVELCAHQVQWTYKDGTIWAKSILPLDFDSN